MLAISWIPAINAQCYVQLAILCNKQCNISQIIFLCYRLVTVQRMLHVERRFFICRKSSLSWVSLQNDSAHCCRGNNIIFATPSPSHLPQCKQRSYIFHSYFQIEVLSHAMTPPTSCRSMCLSTNIETLSTASGCTLISCSIIAINVINRKRWKV